MDSPDDTSERSESDDPDLGIPTEKPEDEERIGGFVFNNELKSNNSEGNHSTDQLPQREQKRIVDLVRLQPTKNRELQKRWEVESGSEVHQYLESELGKFYYRDDDGYIQATDTAEEFVHENQDVYQDVTQPDEESMEEAPNLQRRDLVIALVRLTQELGHLPSAEEISEHGEYSDQRYRDEFGDLFNAYQAAGLLSDDVSRSDFYSEGESGQGVGHGNGKEREAKQIGDDSAEASKNGTETQGEGSDGDSGVINVSEVDVDRPSFEISGTIDESDLIDEIKRFADILGEPPTEELVASYGRYPGEEYRDQFDSWEDALAAAGCDPDELPDWSRRTFTNVEVLDVIRAVADELGRPPTTIETGERAPFSQGLGSTRFGGWATALEMAGLDPSERTSVAKGDEDDGTEDDEGDSIGSVIDNTLEEILLSDDDEGPL